MVLRLGRGSQKDQKFKVIIDYIVTLESTWATCHKRDKVKESKPMKSENTVRLQKPPVPTFESVFSQYASGGPRCLEITISDFCFVSEVIITVDAFK